MFGQRQFLFRLAYAFRDIFRPFPRGHRDRLPLVHAELFGATESFEYSHREFAVSDRPGVERISVPAHLSEVVASVRQRTPGHDTLGG